MGIECRCSACQARFRAPDKYARHKVKCPKCSATVIVGDLAAAPLVAEPLDDAGGDPGVTSTDLKLVDPPSPVAKPAAAKPAPARKRSPPRRDEADPAASEPTEGVFPNIDLDASHAVAPARPTPVESAAAQKTSNLMLWLGTGGGAVAVLVVALVAVLLLRGSSDTPPAKPKTAGTYLVLDWPARDRAGADTYKVYVDRKVASGKPVDDTLRFSLTPGTHQVEIRRRGYDPVTIADLTIRSGETHHYTPAWERSLEGMIAADKPATPTGDDSFPQPRPVPTLDDWLQDFEAAKAKAAKEKKNILVAFDGSDWCPPSMRLANEVFLERSFRDQVDKEFVLVLIDFPKKPPAKAKVEDANRNDALARRFAVTGYPTVILADAQGRPYGLLGYEPGGVDAFMQSLSRWQAVKTQRDELFLEIETLQDKNKLKAIRRAVALLNEIQFLRHYQQTLEQWLAAAEKLDPGNAGGELESVFAAVWMSRLDTAEQDGKVEPTHGIVKELDAWKTKHKFRDVDLAAALHLRAARALVEAGKGSDASKYLKDGLAFNPNNPMLRELLQQGSMAVEGMPAGTGFVIAPGGYILTNHHVIEQPGRNFVQLSSDAKSRVPARVIAKDEEGDMALLKVEIPDGTDLRPIAIADIKIGRGARVGAFGYPGNGAVGSGLKLTTGVISALPDQTPDGMLLLDCRVNPGNSGGPLCDAHGNVVGMVTAKSLSTFDTDSYGMALPAGNLLKFLGKNLPKEIELPEGKETGRSMEWDEIDRAVGASVLMVVKRL